MGEDGKPCCKRVAWRQWSWEWLYGVTSQGMSWYEGWQSDPPAAVNTGGWYPVDPDIGENGLHDYAGIANPPPGPLSNAWAFKAQAICRDQGREGEVMYTLYWQYKATSTDGKSYTTTFDAQGKCGNWSQYPTNPSFPGGTFTPPK